MDHIFTWFAQKMNTNMTTRVWQQTDFISSVPGQSKIGDRLETHEYISSPNNKWHLVVQGDGNLCLYEGWLWISPNCRWASQTCRGYEVPCKLVMHNDGNLALYEHSRRPTWSTGTAGTRAARLLVFDDGQVKLTDAECKTTFWSIKPNRIEFASAHHGYQAKVDSTVIPLFLRAVERMELLQNELVKCKTGPDMTRLLDTLLPHVGQFLTTAKDKTRSLIEHVEQQYYYTNHTRREQERAQMTLSYSQTSNAERLAIALDARIKLLERQVKDAQDKKAQAELDLACADVENIGQVDPKQFVGKSSEGDDNAAVFDSLYDIASERTATLQRYQEELAALKAERARSGTYPEVRIRGIQAEKKIIEVERAWLKKHLDPILSNNDLDQGTKQVFKHHHKGYMNFEPMVCALDGVIRHLVATRMVLSGDEVEGLLAGAKAINNGAKDCRKSAARFGIVL
ncbi:hypothetical protein AMAG_12316 [Allomyces macrogynus ATCC 38327]|uniref:Bulb-type lectin domain-containing protein n=1 Tax=Allomyces macrogynus (strain ATCC 38327) TaxID=578462 RepID=A0A0L0SXM9_ALLM3|nr:hypothetical protein AMAG_12316 [Allomyces macrogynus ATCC 38327]|eukprot:KNE67246.1 hypothetical protein AMAG_12316 [Allomyces macrogynus ATCC 38327]